LKASTELMSFVGRLFTSLRSKIVAWFADAMNGITKFFAGEVHAKDKLCVDDICVTRDQFAENQQPPVPRIRTQTRQSAAHPHGKPILQRARPQLPHHPIPHQAH
jgi:hypothetical protein